MIYCQTIGKHYGKDVGTNDEHANDDAFHAYVTFMLAVEDSIAVAID